MLLGVCCSGGEGHELLTLQPLPLYSAPTDNVTMVSVAATASGRIFLGGAGKGGTAARAVCARSWKQPITLTAWAGA